MENLMLYVGLAGIVLTIAALVKGYETRVVLLASGFALGILAGDPFAPLNGFSKRMVTASLIEPMLSVMGFAYVMKLTKCDAQLVNFMTNALRRVQFILIPGACLLTGFINISLPSAAGCAAAVGSILIPMLIAAGVRPALAGAAIFGGTFGSILSPGSAHNAFISAMVKQPIIEVIYVKLIPVIVALCISAASLTLIGIFFKENKGYVPSEEQRIPEVERTNFFLAMIPILPIVMLIIANSPLNAEFAFLKKLRISHAMIIGAVIGIAATRTNVTEAVREFFKGSGNVYANVMSIIICATVFVGGLEATGVIKSAIALLKSAGDAARYAATFGPFVLAIVTGSGDAAVMAFNEAVTPHAEQFGMSMMNMGCLTHVAGALGRTMSPLTGVVMVCAGLAGVPPLELAKRTAPGIIVAVITAMILLP